MDAKLATEANVVWLRENGYRYLSSAGNAPAASTRTRRLPSGFDGQFTNVPMARAMLCAISLSSGNDSMPITEYPSSHGIR